ncbi:MAG: SpoVA/SpoVAEb family sporulation membrane protein [Emergencia timonensis]
MDYVYTFLIGGAICVIGQILMDDQTDYTANSRYLCGGGRGSAGMYEPLINLAHQGASVPLPGFGYTLAKGAMEGAKEGFLGAITGAVKDSAAGIAVAIAFGYIVSLIFTPKSPLK